MASTDPGSDNHILKPPCFCNTWIELAISSIEKHHWPWTKPYGWCPVISLLPDNGRRSKARVPKDSSDTKYEHNTAGTQIQLHRMQMLMKESLKDYTRGGFVCTGGSSFNEVFVDEAGLGVSPSRDGGVDAVVAVCCAVYGGGFSVIL